MIPRTVHHICEPRSQNSWMPIWKPCYASWRRQMPDHRHWIWSDHRIGVFVREIFPQYSGFFRDLPLDIMRYDIARYLMLYHYGGIYADMDTYVYRDFTHELTQDLMLVEHTTDLVTLDNEKEWVSNWLMCGVAGHGFFIDCVELARYRCEQHMRHFGTSLLEQDRRHQVLYLTGPFVVGQVFCQWGFDQRHQLPSQRYTSQHFYYHDDMCVKHIGTNSWTGWIPGVTTAREGFEYLTEDFDFYQSQRLRYDP